MQKSLSLFNTILFRLSVRISVFWHYFSRFIHREITIVDFYKIIVRLRHFEKKQRQNYKPVVINNKVRTSLYIPSFPSKPFFTSCNNFFNNNNRIRPSVAVISISPICNYSCAYCYQRFDKSESEIPLNIIAETIRMMQDDGVAIFVIEGGDPFLSFDRLRYACSTIDSRSEVWVNTSGDGVTSDRLQELRKSGLTALKISCHSSVKEDHNAFMGSPLAWDRMQTAISLCKELSIPFTINTRILPEGFNNGFFESMMTYAETIGALYVQFLTPRTAGAHISAASVTYPVQELERIKQRFKTYNTHRSFKKFPGIFFDEVDERCIFGCTAGKGRIYINCNGEVQPCQHLNVSFGNILKTPYQHIVDKMNEVFKKQTFTTACTILPELMQEKIAGTPVFPLDISLLDRDKLRKLVN